MMVTVAMAQAQMHTHLHELSHQWTHSHGGRPALDLQRSRASPSPSVSPSASASASASVPALWDSAPVIKFYLECLLRQHQLLEVAGATSPRWARPRGGPGSLQEWRRPKSPDRSAALHADAAAVYGVDPWNASASTTDSGTMDRILAHDADERARRHTHDGRGDDGQSSVSAVHHQQQSASAIVQHGEQLRMRGIQPSRRTNEIHIHIAPAMDTSVKHTIAQ